MNEKAVGIIAGRDRTNNKLFRCVLYSNQLEPVHMMERLLVRDEDLDKIQEILAKKGFKCSLETIQMDPNEWDENQAELTEAAKKLAEDMEKVQAEEKAKYDAKIKETEKKAKVRNLKVFGVTAIAIAAIVGGYALMHNKAPQTVQAPALNTPSVSAPLTPGKTVDERITNMKNQFAKGELYYDITNPDEVEKRINVLIGYFEKMQKGSITKSEATDFYLLLNGIKPSEGVDIDELMRKVQLAAAYDPYFDWREVAGQEIVANKRDSAYLDIYLRAINDWKKAAESHDMKQVSSMGKELVATSYYGMIMKAPLQTQVKEVGNVTMQNVSSEMQTFITGYVGMTLNYPGYDIMEAIGSVTIQGDQINVNAVAEPIAGPQVIPAGEKGATDKGGEQGLAQSTMIMIVNKYNNGEYPECPDEIKARLDSLTKNPVKTLK